MPGLPSEPAAMAIGPASQALRNENAIASAMKSSKSSGWASSILLMAELRKRILTFRGAFDLPPCNASVPINELLMGLIIDLHETYPEAADCCNISSATAEIPLNQVLIQLYNVLKSVGNSWYENNGEEESEATKKLKPIEMKYLPSKLYAEEAGCRVFDNRKAENVASGFAPENVASGFAPENVASGSDHSSMMSVTSYESNVTSEENLKSIMKSDANESSSMQRRPPPPPPPLPPSSKFVTGSGSNVEHDTNRSSEIQKRPPPPPLPPRNPNLTGSLTRSGSMPPPPPPPGIGKNLRPRNNSRLKRSILMVYVYQVLRKKEQGSDAKSKTTQGKKSQIGKTAAAKQGMAEAIEEITRKSAYYQKIEEDARKYAAMVLEMKAAISAFEAKDMEELLKFLGYVEGNLEKLSDESQVLARFEDFPEKKLEALRGAGALYSKLKGMSKKLKEWKIEPPTGQLLDKIETYFNKIKREIETVELSKDEESKRFKSNNIHFDFNVLVQVKESMVDVSSSCMELALKEWREAKGSKGANGGGMKLKGKATASGMVLWRTFQFAYRVYSFAGGQDDRADLLTRELARAMEIDPQPKEAAESDHHRFPDMFDWLLGWRKASKCKRTVRRLQVRMRGMKNKREAMVRVLKQDVAQLIKLGCHDIAFHRVEQLVQDEDLIKVYELLDNYCDVIIINLSYIRKRKDLPNDINEAVSSLVFASARCGDLPELVIVRQLAEDRYGYRFKKTALDLLPGNLVNHQVIERLTVRVVSDDLKLRLVHEIARENRLLSEVFVMYNNYLPERQKQENKPEDYPDQKPDIYCDSSSSSFGFSSQNSFSITNSFSSSSTTVQSSQDELEYLMARIGTKPEPDIAGSPRGISDQTSSSESLPQLPEEMFVYLDDVEEVQPSGKEGSFPQDQRVFKFRTKKADEISNDYRDTDNQYESSGDKDSTISSIKSRRRAKIISARKRSRNSREMAGLVIEEDIMYYEISPKSRFDHEPGGCYLNHPCYFCTPSSDRDSKTEKRNTRGKGPYWRAMSMPQERYGCGRSDEQEKNTWRTMSFPDQSPNHVHPKLPDYDDLAAKFMALKKEHQRHGRY
ncbi:Uncharacterized protein At4g04980 [Linum grandiflorum]